MTMTEREARGEAALIAELQFLPTFVLRSKNGEPLPLADFIRERIAKALTDAAAALAFRRVEVTDDLIAQVANAIAQRATWPSLHWPDVSSLQHRDVAEAIARAVVPAVLNAFLSDS